MAKDIKSPAGDTLESFPVEEGICDKVYEAAVKRVVAWQFEEVRKAGNISKKNLASSMGTSRSQVDRVLDPHNVAMSLEMLSRAASALGKRLKIELGDGAAAIERAAACDGQQPPLKEQNINNLYPRDFS